MAITKTIQATVKNRTDTAANWTQKNPVLAEGEIIVVQTSAGETRLKIGDGVKTFTQLPYTDEQIYNNVVTSVNGQTGDITLDIPGDGVQPDWAQNDETQPDFVKNRPFYTGDPVETVLVEESTVTFEDDGGIYMGQLELTFSATVGETYKVSWDGTTYECACVDYSGTTVIGNLSIIGVGSDTGEPFLMFVNNGLLAIGTADTASYHTFSISGMLPKVVKIDEKYLPDNLANKSEVEKALYTANDAKAIAENAKIDPIDSIFKYPSTLFSKSGEFIGWYEAMPRLRYDETEGGFRLNYRESHYTSLEDIPFYKFICNEYLNFSGLGADDYIMFLNVWNSGDKKFVDGTAINTKGNVFHIKSNKVDPSTVTGIFFELVMPEYMILNSSTANSTKKFHITVNDTGALSVSSGPTEAMEIATKKYVDDKISDKELILSSSTAGSTKKFKLTIDDTGTLTASEITA